MNEEHYFSDGASSDTPLLNIPTKKFTYLQENSVKLDNISLQKALIYDEKKWIKTFIPDLRKDYQPCDKDFKKILSVSSSKKYTHTGLMQYLAIMWTNKKNITLRPDLLHHTITNEIIKYANENIEMFSSIYTKESKKTDMMTVVLPHNTDGLVDVMDSDSTIKIQNKKFRDLFVKTKFISQPPEYEFVKRLCFINTSILKNKIIDDTCNSKQSNSCGFSSIELYNLMEDWTTLLSFIVNLHTMIKTNIKDAEYVLEYLDECGKEIDEIISYMFTDSNDKLKNKLQNIFSMNNGLECKGWITKFYMKIYHNILDYSNHLPYLSYKYVSPTMDTKNYCVITGLTESIELDDTLIPNYGINVVEIINEDILKFTKI